MNAPAPIDPVRLLSSVGHDLRQPFQAMRLFLNLLQMKLQEPKQVELAGRLEEALEVGAAQMDQVLTLAALGAGTARVRAENVPLGPLLARVVGEMVEKAAKAGKRIKLVPTSLSVETDPVMLDRVLRALIDNALTHATPGRRVLVGVRRAGGPALLVADDGPGIQPANRALVLEPGGRLERVGIALRGLGLGLALCHQIAHRLGHELELGGTKGLVVRFGFSR
ncbi:sensor histidine kinase [Niveispirillum sp. KHB5.9]|uniref:sensor histidine kinase n=1 Tax=Niveispirillum sp. KHB5.9 TaxID=3400269 RepID=UPI003A8BC7C9